MKYLILLACLFAVAMANEITHYENDVGAEDFKYSFGTDNHIEAKQQGTLDHDHSWVVTGDYEYISPEGKTIKVAYTADEHGYHPKVLN